MLVGAGAWLLFGWIGLEVPFVYALLFGALISPTDPIAVGAILRKAGVPDSLLVKITGESLFNDGIGMVLFLLILKVATGVGGHGAAQGGQFTLAEVLNLLGIEVVGGLVFGAGLGWLVYRMLHVVDACQVEIGLPDAVDDAHRADRRLDDLPEGDLRRRTGEPVSSVPSHHRGEERGLLEPPRELLELAPGDMGRLA